MQSLLSWKTYQLVDDSLTLTAGYIVLALTGVGKQVPILVISGQDIAGLPALLLQAWLHTARRYTHKFLLLACKREIVDDNKIQVNKSL